MTNQPATLVETRGTLGLITLNRPKALNALDMEQFDLLHESLHRFRDDSQVRMVAVRGAGDRAFCAGGDLRSLWEARQQGDAAFTADIYAKEFTFDHWTYRFRKPYIPLMDGIVMGGGVGVAVYGSHRVVTENTLWAMPETAIGYFPDIGASYFLSRCPGALGLYLGLTGARIRAADVLAAGLADYFVPSECLDDLLEELASSRQADPVLRRFADTPPEPAHLAEHREVIDRCFSRDTVQEIFDALAAEPGDFAAETLKTLQQRPPFSLAVTLRQIGLGAGRSLGECLKMEYRLCQRFLRRHDFFEGIRTVIIEKGETPQWQPATLDEVDPAEVEACFAPLPADQELQVSDG